MNTTTPNFAILSSDDWAFVNNVFAGPEDSEANSTWMLPSKNVMFFNNLFFGPRLILKAGDRPIGNGTTDQFGGISAANYSFYFPADEVGAFLNPNGVSLDCFSGHWVLRNNILPPTDYNCGSGLTTGASAGISTDVAISHPWIMSHNYYYPYGNGTRHRNDMFDNFDEHKYAMEIGEEQPPLYENLPLTSGGANYDSSIMYNFNVIEGSGLIGGGSGSVPFDMNRLKRTERSTAGPYEPRSASTTNFTQLSDTEYNSTDGINLGNIPEELYGKTLKVVAFDQAGNQLESTNQVRLENKWARYVPADVSLPSTYEFARQTGTYHRSTYVPQHDVGEEGEMIFDTTDWLPTAYQVEKIIMYGGTYAGAAESTVSSTIRIDFPDNTTATAFKTAHDAIPGVGIRMDFLSKSPAEWEPADGYLTRHLNKSASTVSGSVFKGFINAGTEGTTVRIEEFMLPENISIFRPSEM